MPDEEVPVKEQPEQPEVEVSGEDVAVEVEKPQNARPALSDEELAKNTDIGDDEIARYNQEAKSRIKGLRTAYQEQRRRAEQWSRDASTASNLAEQLYRENQTLRQNANRSEAALIDQAVERAKAQLEQAKIHARIAQSAQDPDQIVTAQEALARSVAEVGRLELLKPMTGTGSPAEPSASAPQPQPPQSQAVTSERTRRWVEANPWFGKDNEMTQFAMRQHQHLVLDGITERDNPELYWRTIEDRLKQQYPEKFGSARQTESRARPVAVTGGTRQNGAPQTTPAGKRVVHLTESQVKLARTLGLTPEQYAKQLVIDEAEEAKEGRRAS